MTLPSLRTDVAIIGGGIAGLWALNRLRRLGYSALLFEAGSLGGTQTMHAQGIIHGGTKYSLGGERPAACDALRPMPDLWRACLSGDGPVDLRGCRVLSQHLYLCCDAAETTPSGGVTGAAALSGTPLDRADYPPSLRRLAFPGEVRRVDEPVLDMASLVDALAAPHRAAIFGIDGSGAALRPGPDGACLDLPGCSVRPQLLLLAGGAGNAALIERLGGDGPAMQRRPLQQVVVRHAFEEPLFAHVSGESAAPRMTITSHRCSDGAPLWYLGGEIAGDGAALARGELIARARDELGALFPALTLEGAAWATAVVDRAEVERPGGAMPADAYLGPVAGVNNVLVAWPTKLALCPRLGAALEQALETRGIVPRHRPDLARLPQRRPARAAPGWESLF